MKQFEEAFWRDHLMKPFDENMLCKHLMKPLDETLWMKPFDENIWWNHYQQFPESLSDHTLNDSSDSTQSRVVPSKYSEL